MARIAIMVVGFGYAIALTVFLLVPNPAGLVGLQHSPIFPWGKFGVHLLAFVGLGLTINTMRWPKTPSWAITVALSFYGILTETLQLWVPHRTARVMDGFEDVLGVLIGTGVYWLVLQMSSKSRHASLTAELVQVAEQEKPRQK